MVLSEGFGKLIGVDLKAGDRVVVAHAVASVAEGFEDELCLFDLAKLIGGDFGAVGNAGGEAGVGGFVPVSETEFLGVGSDGRFVDLRFLQRGADAMLASGAEAGAVVAEIVGVGAVENPAITLGTGVGDEGVVDVGFTEVTTVGIIDLVARVFGFGGGKFDELTADFIGDAAGVGEVVLGQGGGDRDGGSGVVAEIVVSQFEDEGGVNAARIGDEDAVKPLNERLKLSALFGRWHGVKVGGRERLPTELCFLRALEEEDRECF